jgi:hypothetical protein
MNSHWRKGISAWKIKGVLYISVVFSWQLAEAKILAVQHKGKTIIGGPAAITHKNKIDWANVQDDCSYDTLSMHNPFCTFTSRGCIRKCPFCVVHKVEGELLEHTDWKIAPIICDNNLTATSKKHFAAVIESVKHFPYIDINQGMDARLFTSWHADQLQKLSAVKIRFAFDNIDEENKVIDAFKLCRDKGFNDFGCYVLIGYNDNPDEARYKLELLKKIKVYPMPMRYQPWDTKVKNSFIAEGWTHQLLQDTMRYYSNSIRFGGFDFDSYRDFTHGSNKLTGKIQSIKSFFNK